MITLTISKDNVLIIATYDNVQSRHIHRLYNVANRYIPETYYHYVVDDKIIIKVNSLTELADLMFLLGMYLGLVK